MDNFDIQVSDGYLTIRISLSFLVKILKEALSRINYGK